MVVTVGGLVVGDVTHLTTSAGKRTKTATATINCASPHGRRGDPVVITGQVLPFGVDQIFQGFVETVRSDFFPGEWTIECRGYYHWLDRAFPTDINLSGK